MRCTVLRGGAEPLGGELLARGVEHGAGVLAQLLLQLRRAGQIERREAGEQQRVLDAGHRVARQDHGEPLAAPIALSPILSTPAAAQWIVYDPTNYAQNVLTAARTLQQINNQITSLQNEAQSLINQAKNLANLPYSALQQIQQSVQKTQQLLQQAQGIAFDVQQIDQMFSQKYGNVSMSATASSSSRP